MTENLPRGYPRVLPMPSMPRASVVKTITSCAAEALDLARDYLLPHRIVWRLQLRRVVKQCRAAQLTQRRTGLQFERETNPATKAALGNRHDEEYGEYVMLSAKRRQLKERLGIEDD